MIFLLPRGLDSLVLILHLGSKHLRSKLHILRSIIIDTVLVQLILIAAVI